MGRGVEAVESFDQFVGGENGPVSVVPDLVDLEEREELLLGDDLGGGAEREVARCLIIGAGDGAAKVMRAVVAVVVAVRVVRAVGVVRAIGVVRAVGVEEP